MLSKKLLVHITCWLIATAMLMAVFCYGSSDKIAVGSYVLAGILVLIAGTYLNTAYLVPTLLFRKKPYRYAAAFITVWLVCGTLTMLADYLFIYPALPPAQQRLFWDWNSIFYGSYLLSFFFLATMVGIKVLRNWFLVQQRMKDLEQQKTKAELDFLKGQINPHFLFNAINMIFATIDKENIEARNTVLKFAEILRYQLYECREDLIDIEKELASLRSYFELQRNRKETNFIAELEIGGELGSFKIAPLLLIPIVENAFKYASNHDQAENIVRVKISGNREQLRFSSYNTRDTIAEKEFQHNGGIGMDNIRKRLELLYPGSFNLEVEDSDNDYSVHLSLSPGDVILPATQR